MAESKEPNSRGNPVLAAVLTLILPGLGHAVVGHGLRGALCWVLLLVLYALCLAVSAFWLGALLLALLLTVVWLVACTLDAYRQKPVRSTAAAWLGYVLVTVLTLFVAPIALALGVRALALESFAVRSQGMCPTLQTGDSLFVDKTAYRRAPPKSGDVVLHLGLGPHSEDYAFIHRVVAVEGDEVEVQGGKVSVNGSAVPTRSTLESGCEGAGLLEEDQGGAHRIAIDPSVPVESYRAKVPPGMLYILGDNRTNSFDSRLAGPIAVSSVRGKAWYRWRERGKLVSQPIR